MSNNPVNCLAPTINEQSSNQEFLQLLQETQLCGATLSVYGTPLEPLFLAKEVAEAIDHSNSRMMLEGVDEDEKLMSVILTSGQRREMWFLTEQGLYEVLMQSRKPIAKDFKRGVKSLLKGIRTGELELLAHRQLPLATPIAGIEPILYRGRAWYPIREVLREVTGNKKPNTAHYLESYPDRTMLYYLRSYCDVALARYIVAREELRKAQTALTETSLF